MSDDLRTQIARRLFIMWWNDSGNLSGESSWAGMTDGERKEWVALADEVVRLMEWARRQEVKYQECAWGEADFRKVKGLSPLKYVTLTLPDGEWKP